MLPGFRGQFAQHFQFGELRFVAGIRDATRPQSVAKRKAHVVLLENLADVVKILVQEILLFVMLHPVRHQRAAAAHDSRDPLAHQRHMFAQHAGVNGHVVHALLGLLFNHFQHQIHGQSSGRRTREIASYTGTVPTGTGDASMIALRIVGMSPPVERSITVSAP